MSERRARYGSPRRERETRNEDEQRTPSHQAVGSEE